MFSVEDRKRVRDQVLQLASADARIVAGAVVGSLAFDEGDRWSDLDLTFAVRDKVPVLEVLEDWTRHLVTEFDVAWLFNTTPVTMNPATKEVWIYDLRSNRNFSLRQNPIAREDLTDFINCYCADDRSQRKETAHFRRFEYSEIIARDKANLDIQWQDETTNTTQAGTPQSLMKEILADLEEAIREFAAAEREIHSSDNAELAE